MLKLEPNPYIFIELYGSGNEDVERIILKYFKANAFKVYGIVAEGIFQ